MEVIRYAALRHAPHKEDSTMTTRGNRRRGSRRTRPALWVLCSLLALSFGCRNEAAEEPAPDGGKDDHHTELSEDRFFRFERQEVAVGDFEADGYILDIGGGGEGIIGRIKGNQVISIDISKRELEAAPEGPLKIIMDARDLQFLDRTFNTVTSFFTLMYIDGADHPKVFEEIHRVLKPGGSFLIWDVLYPVREDKTKDVAIIPLRVTLPDGEVTTGYGGAWPDEGRDLTHYLDLAKQTGFDVVSQSQGGRTFSLELRRP